LEYVCVAGLPSARALEDHLALLRAGPFFERQLAPGTKTSYAEAWSLWSAFIAERAPEEPSPYLFSASELRWSRLLVQFIQHLSLDSGIRARRIGQVLCGVRWKLIVGGVPAGVFASDCVEKARQACRPTIEEARDREVTAPREKCPLTVQHLDVLQPAYWQSLGGDWTTEDALDKRMTLLAVLVGYDGSLRACNLARSSKRAPDHTIRGQDIFFVTKERVVRTLAQLPGTEAEEYAFFNVLVFTGKTLRDGAPEEHTFGGASPRERELVTMMFDWCTRSGVLPQDPLFTRYANRQAAAPGSGSRKLLTQKMITEAIKLAAESLGLNRDAYGTHSMRKGGSTTMLGCQAGLESVAARGSWGSEATIVNHYGKVGGVSSKRGALAAWSQAAPTERQRVSADDTRAIRALPRENN
jgi:hypothetical protein